MKTNPDEKSNHARDNITETSYNCPICNKNCATAAKTFEHATHVHFRKNLAQQYQNLFINKVLECPMCQFRSNDHLNNLYHIGLVHNKIYDLMSPGNDRFFKIKFGSPVNKIMEILGLL
jgi:hypothetical protein